MQLAESLPISTHTTNESVKNVVPFTGIISHRELSREKVREELAFLPYRIELTSSVVPFDHTDYYADEMGDDLQRWWVGFGSTWKETDLAEKKREFSAHEEELNEKYGVSDRPVNLDPGYVRGNQVVLASTKYVAHRICIGMSMYAELTLLYENGEFQALPWTYPDYRVTESTSFFRQLRERYFS